MTTSCRPSSCPDTLGCPPNVCPDLTIRQHDTRPAFEQDMDLEDLTDVVVEASMWAAGKLKAAVAADDTSFRLADDIGFQQAAVGDMVLVGGPRAYEQMIVLGFDEEDYLLEVERGVNGTTQLAFRKGTPVKIFRVLNAVGTTEVVTEDQLQIDGTTQTGVITSSKVLYEWDEADTALPGCYWLELKLLKMDPESNLVEWTKRLPADKVAFLIKVVESPTADDVVIVSGRHFYAAGNQSLTGAALAAHA